MPTDRNPPWTQLSLPLRAEDTAVRIDELGDVEKAVLRELRSRGPKTWEELNNYLVLIGCKFDKSLSRSLHDLMVRTLVLFDPVRWTYRHFRG
jgi:hypothetical protein